MKMCIFKKYKDLFGKPGTGVHKYKILNINIVDNLVTIVGCVCLYFVFNIPFDLIVIFVYLLGLLFHYLFGVQTESMKYLGLKCL